MGSIPAEYEEQLKDAAMKLQSLLHPNIEEDSKLVHRGLMLYRQSQVYDLKFDEDGVRASVQDVTPVKVELDLNLLEVSECSCPDDGICRHQLAVFFAIYSKFHSVGNWLDEWREPLKEQSIASQWGLIKAKDLIKANGVLKPDYEQWVTSFEQSFDTLLKTKTHVNPYIVPELFQIYLRRLKAAAPVEQEWKLLYDLIGAVVSFRKLAELSEEMGHTEEMAHRYYGHLFQHLLEESEVFIRKLGIQTLPFAFDQFMIKLKDDSFSLLTASHTLEYERIYFYRLLWTKLLKNRTWREAEANKIMNYLQKTDGSENAIPFHIAGIHLHLLLRQDEMALQMIESLRDLDIVPYLPFWIDHLSGQREWLRAAPYIEIFIQKIKGYLALLHSYYACTDFTKMALKSIAPYCTENGRTELYERGLVQTLPYSYREYENFLFDQQQYDKWGELNAFIGFHLQDVPKDRLKVVEKEHPQVLLSLYHQSVQNLLDMKNRQSYKAAVRQLKKLRTLYKKLKRQGDWIVFFERLLERTKRLRAFHEECRRSKLIDA